MLSVRKERGKKAMGHNKLCPYRRREVEKLQGSINDIFVGDGVLDVPTVINTIILS